MLEDFKPKGTHLSNWIIGPPDTIAQRQEIAKIINKEEGIQILTKRIVGQTEFLRACNAGHRVVGAIQLVPCEKHSLGLIHHIVRKTYRNDGIEQKLLDYAFREANKRSLSKIFLVTRTTADYEKRGFRQAHFVDIPGTLLNMYADLAEKTKNTGRPSLILMQYAGQI